jgi:hypothetical protein
VQLALARGQAIQRALQALDLLARRAGGAAAEARTERRRRRRRRGRPRVCA